MIIITFVDVLFMHMSPSLASAIYVQDLFLLFRELQGMFIKYLFAILHTDLSSNLFI